MGWHWNSGEDGRRGSALWIIIPLIVLGVLLLSNSGRGGGWGWSWWWLFFIIPCFLGPKLWRSVRRDDESDAKRKNDFDFEKPKRTITRDDGELEIIDEDPQPRPRRDAPDDIDYV